MLESNNPYKNIIEKGDQTKREGERSSSPQRLSQEKLVLSPDAVAEEDQRAQKIEGLRAGRRAPSPQERMDIVKNTAQMYLSSHFGDSSADSQVHDRHSTSQQVHPLDNPDIETGPSRESLDQSNSGQSEVDLPTDGGFLIPKDMQEAKKQDKEIKSEILDNWPTMLISRNLKDSYDFTIEFKNLRDQKKSRLKKDPNGYINDLASFQGRMLNQGSRNYHVEPLEMLFPYGLYRMRHDYYPEVLSKLQNLASTELGTGESKTELINICEDVKKKLDKTHLIKRKYYQESSDPISSSDLYHAWMKELDRRLDAFKSQS